MTTTGVGGMLRQARSRIAAFPYPHQAAFLLDNPVRRAVENPAAAVDTIGLRGNERVLELGPGAGYFSVEIARRLTTGRLDLLDIQPQMLQKARRKLARAGYPDVGLHVGDAASVLPFGDEVFDVAFLAEVIGEVRDQRACLRSLARVLRPHAVLVFHEAFPDPDRLTVAQLRSLAEPEGFDFCDAREGRWKDTVRFRKRA